MEIRQKEDPRGHSVLILGKKDETYLHIVCCLKDDYYDAETALRLDEFLYETKPDIIIEVPVFEYK